MNEIYRIFFLFLASLVVASFAHRPVLVFARRYRFYDNPSGRKLQRRPIPLLGGLVVFVGLTSGLALSWVFHDMTGIIPLYVATAVMLVLGTIDDAKDIRPSLRVLVEIIVIVALMLVNGYGFDDFHGMWGIGKLSPWISWPLTVFGCVGIINAFNMVDGVDGLSSGISIIAFGVLGLMFFNVQDYVHAIVAVCMIGALIPFFIVNVFGRISKMFIGDGGTLMIGIVMCDLILTLASGSSPCREYAEQNGICILAFVLAAVAVPVFDAVRVMLKRVLEGRPPFSPDKSHLHHAFIDYGFHHLETSLIEIDLGLTIVAIWWAVQKSHLPSDFQFLAVFVSGICATVLLYYLLGRRIRIAAKEKHELDLTPEEYAQADLNTIRDVLNTLVRAAVSKVEGKVLPDSVLWKGVFNLSVNQGVAGLAKKGLQNIFDQAYDSNALCLSSLADPETRKLMLKWGFKTVSYERISESHNQAAAQLRDILDKEGFDSCILKGQSLAFLYEHPEMRQPGDMDIWVRPKDSKGDFAEDRRRVLELFRSKWKVSKPTYHHCQAKVFKDIPVEVHYLPAWLYNPIANRKLLRFFREQAPEQFSNTNELGFNVPTIRFNLIFLMVHLSKHALESNVQVKQLVDYANVLKHSTEEDRKWAFRFISSLGLGRYARQVMWELHDLVNLPEEYLLCDIINRPAHGLALSEEIMKGPWRIWHWFFRKKISR